MGCDVLVFYHEPFIHALLDTPLFLTDGCSLPYSVPGRLVLNRQLLLC